MFKALVKPLVLHSCFMLLVALKYAVMSQFGLDVSSLWGAVSALRGTGLSLREALLKAHANANATLEVVYVG
jgi:hypothetical protein